MTSVAQTERPSILLIDDSSADLRVLLDMMDGHGLRVHVALNGQDGLMRAELVLPALILLDVNMPGMDGFATCRRLKANPRTRDIPVLFLTAATELERRLEGLSIGAVDYIAKPFSEAEVLARVGIHLDIARRLRQVAEPEPGLAEPERGLDLDGTLPQRDLQILRLATDILRKEIAAPPSPEALARQLGTNEKRLNQIFHAGFALPVFGWLREERLRLAREYLTTTDSPIWAIAEHLGYSSQANFTRAFHHRFGIPPSHLRGPAPPGEGTPT